MEPAAIIQGDAAEAGRAFEDPAQITLTVSAKQAAASGVYLFELRDPQGRELPPFTPGAHLTVSLPNGMKRNYSLCGDPFERHRYLMAVKRDEAGRGGSLNMADDVQVGHSLSVSEPHNHFELSTRAKGFLFIAGGIGITPILSMMRHLKRADHPDFKLYYLTRDAASTAFLNELTEEFPGQVKVHHDHGERDQAFDLWALLAKPTKAHIYCCGPQKMMDAVQAMSGHWPSGTVHFESFGVDPAQHPPNRPFIVHLKRSDATFEVGANETLLEALRQRGYRVPSSCESGTCGSCKTRLLAGDPEHRDIALSSEERADHIMVCVSRARSAELELDL